QYDKVIYIPKKTKNKRSFYDYVVEKILEANNKKQETELEEEALRIDFVAFTRAKKELYLITEKSIDYLNEFSEKMEIEGENTCNSFEEKQKRAYNLFLNKNYDEAKKLLEKDSSWLKKFVENHFASLEHISFSRLTTNPFDYFINNILQLRTDSFALNIGSEVHDLLQCFLEGRPTNPSKEAKQFFENGIELIELIKKDYPEFVSAEHEVYLPLNKIISTKNDLNFKGLIDAIFKNKENYLIVDWKTSRTTDSASTYRRQLELYKRAFAEEKNIPLDKIKVAIAFVGLRKIINDGNIYSEIDEKQPRSSVFNTIQKHLEKFLEWKDNPENFFKDLKEVKTQDPLIRSILEQYEKE
ncbi:PD-(D/E)XK nuclease family protein, partial [Candidatus Micrarchaeota archaeon]|nr:PD-(D/E)XK nuclease family protein [Candidatus Micrarchaeota archaeon]